MKSRMIALPVVFALAGMAAFGAGIDGKWVSDASGKGILTLSVKSSGPSLTGTMDNALGTAPITEGMIKDGEVSFKVVRVIGDRGKFTQTYKGKLAGDEIKFTVSTDAPQRAGQTGELVFKRSK